MTQNNHLALLIQIRDTLTLEFDLPVTQTSQRSKNNCYLWVVERDCKGDKTKAPSTPPTTRQEIETGSGTSPIERKKIKYMIMNDHIVNQWSNLYLLVILSDN